MITAQRLTARAGLVELAALDFAFGPGLRAVVGRPEDGRDLLLAVLAGIEPRKAGQLFVLGGEATEPAIRAQIGFVPLDPPWPPGMRVDEAFALAAAVRGGPAPALTERFTIPGIRALAGRRGHTLRREERRALALAEALTAPGVRLVLVDEPFLALPPELVAEVPRLLRLAAADGKFVLVGTSSLRDATDLAEDLLILFQGRLALRTLAMDAFSFALPPRLRIATSDIDALLAAMPQDPRVAAVERLPHGVVVTGPALHELAVAVAEAVIASGANVDELRAEGPQLVIAPPPRPGTAARLVPSRPPPPLLPPAAGGVEP